MKTRITREREQASGKSLYRGIGGPRKSRSSIFLLVRSAPLVRSHGNEEVALVVSPWWDIIITPVLPFATRQFIEVAKPRNHYVVAVYPKRYIEFVVVVSHSPVRIT